MAAMLGALSNIWNNGLFGNAPAPRFFGSSQPSNAQTFMATGNNIYGNNRYDNADQRLIRSEYQGTPWYKAQPGNAPKFDPFVQGIMDKQKRWDSMSWAEQTAKANDPTYYVSNEEKAQALRKSREMDWATERDMKDLMLQQAKARGEAMMRENPLTSAGWNFSAMHGRDLAQGNNWHTMSLQDPRSKVALPDGNQLGRIVHMASSQGVNPNERIREFANQADAFADWWNPSGQWNTWFSGSGSREGLGGVGSGQYFRGTLPGEAVYPGGREKYETGSNYAGRLPGDSGKEYGPELPPGWKDRRGGSSMPPYIREYNWPDRGNTKLAGNPFEDMLGDLADIFGKVNPGLVPQLPRDVNPWSATDSGWSDDGVVGYEPNGLPIYEPQATDWSEYSRNLGAGSDSLPEGYNTRYGAQDWMNPNTADLSQVMDAYGSGLGDALENSGWGPLFDVKAGVSFGAEAGAAPPKFRVAPGAHVVPTYMDVFSQPLPPTVPPAMLPSGIRNMYTGLTQGALDARYGVR